MSEIGRYYKFFIVLFAHKILCGSRNTKDMQIGKSLHELLAYLHGYKMGQQLALQLPPVSIPCLIIVPNTSQHQSITLQMPVIHEHYQEIMDNNIMKPHILEPTKVVDSFTESKMLTENNIIDKENYQSLKRDINKNKIFKGQDETDKLRQFDIPNTTTDLSLDINSTTESETSITITNTEVNTEKTDNETTVEMETSVTDRTGPYPSAAYTNDFISDLTFTTTQPVNNFVLQLPLPRDDRWRNFSSKNNNIFYPSSTGFRPLAGLYYDGFLHKNLIKKQGGWSPFLS